MNKQAIYHEGDSNLCYPINKNTITLRLRVAKEDVFDEIKVVYGNKYDYYIKQEEIAMSLKYELELFKYYEVTIKLRDVRFVYIFKLICKGRTYYFCEDGVLDNYDFSFAYFNCFQYPFINDIDVPKYVVGITLFRIGLYGNTPAPSAHPNNCAAGIIDIGRFARLNIIRHIGTVQNTKT